MSRFSTETSREAFLFKPTGLFMLDSRIFSIIAIVSSSVLAEDTLRKTGDFALLDQNGKHHQLRKYAEKEAAIFLSISEECSKSLEILKKYIELSQSSKISNIVFFAIDSTYREASLDGPSIFSSIVSDLPILMDDSLLITESLGMQKVGDLVFVEPYSGNILYHGTMSSGVSVEIGGVDFSLQESAVSDPTTLLNRNASGSIQSSVLEAQSKRGCDQFLSRAQNNRESPDYATEVAPILSKRCVQCHVSGGIAPFAMDSYEAVRGWSSMIKEVLLTRRMPPMQVDPRIKHFTNASYIKPSEMRILIQWIDQGALSDRSTDDPLKLASSKNTLWELGEPDYILRLPAFRVPATGVLDYENVTLDLPFTKGVWIKSVQFIPGDKRALHHLMTYVAPTDFTENSGPSEARDSWKFLEGYAPGKDSAISFPDHSGVFIPARSTLSVSLHYTTFGKEAIDQTIIGLYFADEKPRFEYSTYALSRDGSDILIPPSVAEYKMGASHTFTQEIVLHGLRPHMHYRGKYMRMSVQYPDGTLEDLINVPDYNFAWQPTYRLTKPILLPSGSRVIIDGAFDNSIYNLGNPDPYALVQGGAQSWDEMFIGYFSYYRTGN